MADIRTPDDEIDQPGYFYPPFRESWWYEGQTYGGHSDFAVDWNRRTATRGWVQDLGDPVLAAADGTVAQVDPAEGLVMLNHPGAFAGEYRTEYRHMQDIVVKVGDKVQRGDRIGSIGAVGSNVNITSPHLHHRHYRRSTKDEPFKPIQMRFLGKPIATSVSDSDSRPKSWEPPTPVMVQGPPARPTWPSAFQEAYRMLMRTEKLLKDSQTAKGLAEDALSQEKAAHLLTKQAVDMLGKSLGQAMDDHSKALGELAACQTAHEATKADLASAESRIEILESGQNLDEVRKLARQGMKDQALAAVESLIA